MTPLGKRAELYYPLGYPVSVATDNPEVIGLINRLWGDWPRLVSGDPLRVSIQVSVGRELKKRFLATPAGFRMDGPASAIFDAESHRLSIRTANALSKHFLHSALLTALDFSLFTPLHAACVVHNGCGVLLCGDSGAGKSTLAYACARRGFALVSDDSLRLLPGHGSTVAALSSSIHLREPARSFFPELAQEPIVIAPNGKRAIEIDAVQRGLHTARSACVERILFLSRRPGPPQLSDFDLHAAEQYFVKYLWHSVLDIHKARIHEIVTSTNLGLFEYESVEDAIDALEELLKEKVVAA